MKKRQVKSKKGLNKIAIFLLCLITVYIFAIAGSIFTSSQTQTAWYQNNKPSLTPPNFIFPIVWNILFFLIALSLFFAWTNAKNKKQKRKTDILFALNLLLNTLWSFLFFGLQNPLAAFIELIFLWLSILSLIIGMWKISKASSYLLIPYFLWVSFAAILNFMFI
jgi:tryptophan-rich sensory protein